MSPNTKQVLAITLGTLGLILGIFATVVAYNAKQATENDQNVTTEVQQQFAAAQSAQDAKEATQASRAEKLIAGLSRGEKSLVAKINSNAKGIKKLKKQNKNQNSKINSLKNKTNTLTSRDSELDSELTTLENSQQKDFNSLTKRINNLNQEIKDLQQSLNRLRNRVGIDEDLSN